MPTALEIAQVSGNEYAANLLMGVIASLPVIATFDARENVGDKILSLGIVALPTGKFINLGEGLTAMQTDTALAEYNAARIGGSVKSQVSTEAKWNARNRAAIGAGLASDYFSIQSRGAVLGQLRLVQRCVFGGTSIDPKSGPGLKALTPFVSGNVLAMTDTAQDSGWTKSVLNVTGTTGCSSIYSVCFGPMDAQLCIGGPNGLPDFLTFPTPTQQWLETADPVDGVTKGDWYNIAANEGYIGLSLMGGNEANASRKFPQFSVRRAANVSAETGKGCTAAVFNALYDAHPEGHKPSAFYLSHRSRKQYQDSLTAVTTTFLMGYTGAAKDAAFTPAAPIPTHWEGIPIIATDAIPNTDSAES